MKKIMFNDRYGLTDAVLSGRKTMTRRIVKGPRRFKGCEDTCLEFHQRLGSDIWYDCVVTDGDEDCLKEGVEKWMDCYIVSGIMERGGKSNVCFDTPREAFAALIDRICGRGTSKSNPWVVACEFELIKKD